MTEENSDQAIGGSIDNSNQFPDSEWLRTENKRYAVNLTDRDCGTAKIYIKSIREDNDNNSKYIHKTLGTITMDPDCPVDRIESKMINKDLIALQVEQETNSTEDEYRAQSVVDRLISEL